MNTKETLQKLQSLHLMMADEIKRICEMNNIKYFMIYGTLLGAIRHQGFIPWDDDFDFGMTRYDYERFIIICEKELDHSIFYLQTDRKDKYYPFTFAKLRLNGTAVKEEFSDNIDIHQGIYIDIFPIDVVPNNPIKKWLQLHIFYVTRNLLWIKSGYGTKKQKEGNIYKLAKLFSHLFSINMLKKIKLSYIARYANQKSFYVIIGDGAYGIKKELIETEIMSNIVDYQFEDRVYPGIADYDSYLTHFYDDYMKFPPKEKRNHHNRISVDFGEYV